MLLSPQPFRMKVRRCFTHLATSGAALPQQAETRLNGALFRPPLPEPCVQVSKHTALQFPGVCWVGVPHLAYRPRSQRYSLFPFVLSQALPWAFGDSGNSVALLLAQGRRSRLDAEQTLVRVGFPFASLLPLTGGRSPERVFGMPSRYMPVPVSPLQAGCGGHRFVPLEARIQPIQAWPLSLARFLAHRICGASHSMPSGLAAFPTCSCPRGLSAPGQSGILGRCVLSTSCPSGAICSAPKRRT